MSYDCPGRYRQTLTGKRRMCLWRAPLTSSRKSGEHVYLGELPTMKPGESDSPVHGYFPAAKPAGWWSRIAQAELLARRLALNVVPSTC